MAIDYFEGRCGSCVNLDVNDWYGSKSRCYCRIYGRYVPLTCGDARICTKYEVIDSRYRDYYNLNHRWHIVSAIFKKLGLYDLEYECISILENFRINVLEKDEKYADVLKEYDLVGPAIAKFLMQDDNCIEICKKICSTTLINVLDMIKQGKNDEALKEYINLVNILKEYYKDNFDEKVKNK